MRQLYFLLFALWVILNGQITLEIVLFGLVIAAILYAFVCKFMDYSIKKDLFALKKIFSIVRYIVVLVKEIVCANMATIHLILSSKEEVEPEMVTFRTNLKTSTARACLANAITLTPGTITVSLKDNHYVVHCLDHSLAEGMDSSVFVTMLEKMEKGAKDSGKGV